MIFGAMIVITWSGVESVYCDAGFVMSRASP